MSDVVNFPVSKKPLNDDERSTYSALVSFASQEPMVYLLRLPSSASRKLGGALYAVMGNYAEPDKFLVAKGGSLKDTLFVMNACRRESLKRHASFMLPKSDKGHHPDDAVWLDNSIIGEGEFEIVAQMDVITGMMNQVNFYVDRPWEAVVKALDNAVSYPSIFSSSRVVEDIKTGMTRLSSCVQRTLAGTLFWERENEIEQVRDDDVELITEMFRQDAFGPPGMKTILRLIRAVGLEMALEVQQRMVDLMAPSRDELPEHMRSAYDWSSEAFNGKEVNVTVYQSNDGPVPTLERIASFGEEDSDEFRDFWADLIMEASTDDETIYVIQKTEATPLFNTETRAPLQRVSTAVLDYEGLHPVEKDQLRRWVENSTEAIDEETREQLRNLIFSRFVSNLPSP